MGKLSYSFSNGLILDDNRIYDQKLQGTATNNTLCFGTIASTYLELTLDNNDYFFDTIVMAHTHKTGHYDIGNSVIYEQGCCCETSKMDYADGKLTPSQREGFILVYQDKFGRLNEDKTHIVRLN